MTNVHRRQFLQWLLSLPLAGALAHPVVARLVPRQYWLNPFLVAGLADKYIQPVIQRLHPGEELCLVAEPTHPHDEFAVEVFYGECKLGYVPPNDNQLVSRLLQQGVKLTCKVLEVKPGTDRRDRIRVHACWII